MRDPDGEKLKTLTSLAQQLPPGLQGQFGALHVRVQLPPGASEADMSEAIAQAIINALQQRN